MLTRICCCLTFILFAAVIFAYSQIVATPAANNEVKAKLSLADGKTVYRTGEAIKLILSFTASGKGYQLNTTTTTPASPVDDVIVTPDAKTFHWLDIYSGAHRYYPDYAGISNLSETPAKVELALNSWYRFDHPGRYTVKVKTSRVRPPVAGANELFNIGVPLPLLTNEVSFEIKPMNAKEERKEIQRLGSLIDQTKDWMAQAEYARQLAFLTGDPATREKVKRFLIVQNTSAANYFQEISLGLYISQNKKLAIKLFEEKLNDPSVPATYGMLGNIIGLSCMQDREERMRQKQRAQSLLPDPKTADQEQRNRCAQVAWPYIASLVNTLPKRTGDSLVTTVISLLNNIHPGDPQYDQNIVTLRTVLLREFPTMTSAYQQEGLLRVYWKEFKDPSLLPVLEKMLREERSHQIREVALDRLWELSPARARPFYIQEIKDPASYINLEILGRLPDRVLPEADDVLLEQIKDDAVKNNLVDLRTKAMRAARYASPAIYKGLLEIYRTYASKWGADQKGFLLSYLARCNEADTLPLIEKELNELKTGYVFSYLPSLTNFYYSDGINNLLIRYLNGDNPEISQTAAYVISKYGPPEDAQVLRVRLGRWRQEWAARIAENDLKKPDSKTMWQATLERELILALINAENWKLSGSEIAELKAGCQTKICVDYFQVRIKR